MCLRYPKRATERTHSSSRGDYAVEPNNRSDVEILQRRLKGIRENTGCTDMYVDGAFNSEDVRRAAKENGIKIHLTNMNGRKPSKRLPASEFDIDETTDVIKRCPEGHIPTHAGTRSGQTCARFPHEVCSNCKSKGRCHSKRQAKDYVVRFSLKAVETGRE